MKRKLMAALLALVMCLSLLPTVAWAGESNVAKINGKTYTTLAKAVAAAKDGDTVTLLKDCEITDPSHLTRISPLSAVERN